jgi:hypothetical protein
MLMSLPALAVITAIGISRATESIDLKGMSARRLQTLSLLLFIIWISYQDIRFYHFEYRAGHYFEDPANEFTYETASIISPLHDSGRLYLLTDPGVPYLSFANFSYLSPDVDKAYLDDPSAESLADLPTDKDILFIATPGRFVDLQTLASLVPGGEWTEFQRRYQPGDMLYYSYKITQSDLQSLRP